MEDNLISLKNVRQPKLFVIKDDLTFCQTQDDPRFWQMEDNLIFCLGKTTLIYFFNGRRPEFRNR